MNIKVDFWMERVISWNNGKVPDPICVNTICSMLYIKWSTHLRWALTEGHPVWKGGIFGTRFLNLRTEKNSTNQGDLTTRSLSTKLYEHSGFMTLLSFKIYQKFRSKLYSSTFRHLHFLLMQIRTISFSKSQLWACIPLQIVISALSYWFLVQISKRG